MTATLTTDALVSVPIETWEVPTAVITFDDGYVANPAVCVELQKRGMRASRFRTVAGTCLRTKET